MLQNCIFAGIFSVNTQDHLAMQQKLSEKLGMVLSVGCAIHCLATPFVITALPFLGGVWENVYLEGFLLSGSLCLAVYLLMKDFIEHRQSFPLILLFFGSILNLIGFFSHQELLTILGGFTLAAAYLVNWQHRKTCKGHRH